MSRLALLFMALFACGCSTLADGSKDSWHLWPSAKEEKPGRPDKILASWTDTVLTSPGKPPIRGFGGRLMFYAGESEKPIKVDGTLVVYAFDESNRDPSNVRPDRKYVILPQQLPDHFSKSKIGNSYSVWIPWDEVGGVQKEITLIARFEPKQGAIVMGEQCRQSLPGMPPQGRAATIASLPVKPPMGQVGNQIVGQVGNLSGNQNAGQVNNLSSNGEGVRQVSYQAPIQPETQPKQAQTASPQQMTTTTIPLPPGMAARWPETVRPAGPPPEARQQMSGNYTPPPPWTYRRGEQPPAPAATAAESNPANWWSASRPQFGSPLDRLRPLGKPLERLNRDRVPSPQPPAESPSGPGTQSGMERANAAPAGWSSAPPVRN